MYFATPGPSRPLGVTILVVLQIIAGIVDIVIGLLLALVYAIAASFLGLGLKGFAALVLPSSLLFFAMGVFSFILAYGLWTGQGWAWTFSVILALIGLGISTIGLFLGDYANIIPILFYTLILIYLMTYNVRAFFGRGLGYPMPYPGYVQSPPPQPAPQYQQPTYYPTPPPPAQTSYRRPSLFQRTPGPLQRTGMCPTCLSPVEIGAPYCVRCGSRLR
jgi:hypothetical protein